MESTWMTDAELDRSGIDRMKSSREMETTTGGFNLLPFAAMAGGWIAPLLLFWLALWGPFRPYGYPDGDLMPPAAVVIGLLVVSGLPLALPRGYFRTAAFERSRRIYRWLGVHWFRAVVPDGDVANRLRRMREPGYRVVRSRGFVEAMWARTVAGERSHLVLLLFGAGSAGIAAAVGWHGWAGYLAGANVLVNLYPVLLQRYTRARLEPLRRPGAG
jgi:hypothetical protein